LTLGHVPEQSANNAFFMSVYNDTGILHAFGVKFCLSPMKTDQGYTVLSNFGVDISRFF